MERAVTPEILDRLPATDPEAVGSRRDLRRLNWLMNHAALISSALRNQGSKISGAKKVVRITEIGAGDGTLLLEVARRLRKTGLTFHATLIDRQNVVSPETMGAFAELRWSVETVATDVFEWLRASADSSDAMVANLFLHHFERDALKEMLLLAALRTNFFIACEPDRNAMALAAVRMLWFAGCNRVTRHDAVVSYKAGFSRSEISSLWPAGKKWNLSERNLRLFTHRFIAQRHD